MGKNCVLVIDLMVRGYFRGITELNQEKMTVAETFYPPPQNWEVHIANLRPQKNGFEVKFQTQKHGTNSPVRKHGKYPPGKLIASLQSYHNLANLVSLVKSLELFVIQKLTNQIP